MLVFFSSPMIGVHPDCIVLPTPIDYFGVFYTLPTQRLSNITNVMSN